MIELRQVTKTFHAGGPNAHTAVDGVSLHIPRGALTVLKGPSGSGKTTLLSLIGCMARPTSGRILLRGLRPDLLPGLGTPEELEITSLPERFLTRLRRAGFGFIFQQFNLIRGVSALENVMLPGYPTGRSHGDLRARALALLDRFEVAGRAGTLVERLSGGELQRVAIARALVNDPEVVLADEPTAHLDRRLALDLMALVGDLKAAGTTLVIASHDPVVHDSPLADQVLEVRDGKVAGTDP